MYWIITVCIVVYIALLGLFAALTARKQNWAMVLIRTGIIILSTVLSVPLSKLISSLLGTMVYGLVEKGMDESMQEFLAEVPLSEESIHVVVALLIAPAVFLLMFALISGILRLLSIIPAKTVPYFKRRPAKNSYASVPIGALNGVLMALLTLMPLCGYVTLVHGAADAFFVASGAVETPSVQEAVEDYGDILEIVDGVGNAPLVKELAFVSSPVFNWLTTEELDTEEISFCLNKEVEHLALSGGKVMCAVDAFGDEDFTVQDKETLTSAVDTLFTSQWVTELASDSIVCMAKNWQEGDDFFGMAAPELGSMLDPTMDQALAILATEDSETLREDLHTVIEILSVLLINDFLTETDYEVLLAKLGEDGLLNGMLATLGENEHLAPMANEIKALSVRVVSSVLGEQLANSDQYDGLMDDVATNLNDVLELSPEERRETVKDAVQTAFVDYGVTVPEDVAVEMSEKAIGELGQDGEITGEELKQYMIDHMDEELDLIGDAAGDIEDIIPDGEIPDMN